MLDTMIVNSSPLSLAAASSCALSGLATEGSNCRSCSAIVPCSIDNTTPHGAVTLL